MKSAGASFRNHLANCMQTLGYTSCQGDRNFWRKAMTIPDDGQKYYAYIILYVDDILAIHHNAMSALNEIDKFFHIKPESKGNPTAFGAKICKVTLPNGLEAWSASPSKFVQESIKNVKEYTNKEFPGMVLPKNLSAPFPRGYEAETDVSPVLTGERANSYQ